MKSWDIEELLREGYDNLPYKYVEDVMKAYLEGKDIEFIMWNNDSNWVLAEEISWDWKNFMYRVK